MENNITSKVLHLRKGANKQPAIYLRMHVDLFVQLLLSACHLCRDFLATNANSGLTPGLSTTLLPSICSTKANQLKLGQ